MDQLSESQVAAEVARAQADIEQRLNALELRIGRALLSMELERVDISTSIDTECKWVRVVRIVVPPPPGFIGRK